MIKAIDGSTGKISAKDVELRGSISATSGVIGGFELSDGILEAKDSRGKTVAFINGTDEYSDEENGKLLIAAGITDDKDSEITLYKWTNISDPDYTNIYTTQKYGVNETDDGSYDVEVYQLTSNGASAKKIYGNFVYYQKKVEADDDLITTVIEGDESTYYYSEYIAHKNEEDGNEYKFVFQDESTKATGLTVFETSIYGNGRIFTNDIYANGGYFAGSINSNGSFFGSLDGANGRLTGASISDSEIKSSNIVIDNKNTLNGVYNGKNYLTISSKEIQSDIARIVYSSEGYYEYMKNKSAEYKKINGTQTKGPYYFEKGAKISVGRLTGYMRNFLPNNRNISYGEAWAIIKITVEYDSKSVVDYTHTRKLSRPGQNGGNKDYTWDYSADAMTITDSAPSSGKITWKIDYFVPCPRRNGTNYCSSTIQINFPDITIEYEKQPDGIYIGNNGIKIIDGPNIFSMIDDKITMENDNYGLMILWNGVQIKRHGVWTDL